MTRSWSHLAGGVTYSVRLDRIPVHTDGTALVNETVEWFVMVYFDVVEYTDGKYKDLTLVPSFYRTFTGKHNPNNAADDGDWDDWKDFRIHRASYGEWEGQGKQTSDRATSVKLTHEVWDHNANCPVHESKPVTVGVGSEPVAPDRFYFRCQWGRGGSAPLPGHTEPDQQHTCDGGLRDGGRDRPSRH